MSKIAGYYCKDGHFYCEAHAIDTEEQVCLEDLREGEVLTCAVCGRKFQNVESSTTDSCRR